MAFLIALFILGLLIIVHEFGHFFVAKKMGVKVERFSLGFGPQLFSFAWHDTQYCIRAIPLGGYVKLAGDNPEEQQGKTFEYLSQPPGRRFWILFCGPCINYICGFIFFWLLCIVGYPVITTRVAGVLDGFGAEEAGLQTDDRITSVDGIAVTSLEELQSIIQGKEAGTVVHLSFLRADEEQTAEVTLKAKEMDDLFGKKRSLALLGATFTEVTDVKHGLLESLPLAVDKTRRLTALTYMLLWRLIRGSVSFRDSVAGPLGILNITSQAVQVGLSAVMQLLAVLSISLALFNLLPLPLFDGGHILFLGLEKLRKKPLSQKAERIVNQIGFTFIIMLALLATYNDISRMIGNLFNTIK